MSIINWIHMSDIHYNFENYDTMRMRDKTLEYLVKMNVKFDFILITGDIRYKGSNYTAHMLDFINNLSIQLEIPKSNFFIVPGNHDINRSKLRTTIINGILANPDPVNEVNELDLEIYNELIRGQDEFNSFYMSSIGREYPKDQLHFIEERDKYNIVHVNTCLLSGQDGEEGKLIVGQKKLNQALKELGESNKINIAIGHHSIECLNPIEQNLLMNNFADYSVSLYLSGHIHQPKSTFDTNNINDIFMFSCGSGMSDNFSTAGIITGMIDLNHRRGKVVFHKWELQKEYWHIANDVSRKAPSGEFEFNINNIYPETQSDILTMEKESRVTNIVNFYGSIQGQVHTGSGDIIIKKLD